MPVATCHQHAHASRRWHSTCLGLLLSLALLLTACGGDTSAEPAGGQARLRVVGTLATVTPTLQPATSTPSPTPLPSPTPFPTPRRVRVSRINDNINPAAARLLTVGQTVPALTLTDIDGQTYPLHEQQGRVIIINFWTVGCGSCFYEFPLFQQIHEAASPEELLILGVNVSDTPHETRNLAASLDISFPLAVDPQGEAFIAYFGGAVVPTTYFIDATGTVQQVVVGPLDFTTLADILDNMGLEVTHPAMPEDS